MKVVYNGVEIERALTTSWNEVVQYDEAGVNMLGSKITMTFEGTVTSASLLGYPDTPHTTIPAPTSGQPLPENVAYNYRLNNVLRLLEMPRQTLEVYDDANGALIFAAYSADYFSSDSKASEEAKRNMDVDNGPKPRNVQVVQQVRNYARVSFTVDVMKIRCLGGETGETPLGNDPTQGFVVSNRCWTDESLDEAFYITRTFTGRLRISDPRRSVHFYRDVYYPPLEVGFYRQSVRFSESEDGLSLNYSITDKQRRTAAPYPCTKIDGSAKYTVVNMGQAIYDVEVSAVGAPYAPKQALVTRVLDLLGRKVNDMIKDAGADGYIPNFEVSENFGDPPTVLARARFILQAYNASKLVDVNSNALFNATGVGISQIGRPLDFDPWEINGEAVEYKRYLSQTPNPFGYQVYSVYDSETSAAGGVQEREESGEFFKYIKCLASVPCVARPLGYNSGLATERELDEEELKTIVQNDGTGVSYGEKKSGVVKSAVEFPWTFYKSHIVYDTNNMTVALPSAMGSAEGSGSPVVVKLAGSVPKARVVIEAERKNALPTFPNPRTAVEVAPRNKVSFNEDFLTFTPLNSSVQYSEPQRGTIGEDIVYSGKCEIEYAMSREFNDGDEVWLLGNPTFQDNCLYPVNSEGKPNLDSFYTSFDGVQLSRDWDNSEQDSSDANDDNNQQIGESNE